MVDHNNSVAYYKKNVKSNKKCCKDYGRSISWNDPYTCVVVETIKRVGGSRQFGNPYRKLHTFE